MKIAVWDTYVAKNNGTMMHFDILVHSELKDTETIFQYGQHYLLQKGQEDQHLTAQECRLCHTEHASPDVASAIRHQGYAIVQLQGCD